MSSQSLRRHCLYWPVVLFLFFTTSAGKRSGTATAALVNGPALTDQQIRTLTTEKVFFGHKSVGANIIEGVKELMAVDPRLRLRMVTSSDPGSVPAPAFIEAGVGDNGNPQSKDQAFAAMIGKGPGMQHGVAMYKYCYVDITASTDVRQIFSNYSRGIDALKSKYPSLKIVHITAPLTAEEPAGKAWLKSTLGRTTVRDDNARRNEFNELLKKTYSGDSIFDLAEVESTHPDGSRSYFTADGKTIYTLAPEYTTDGGHLNDAGRRVAAKSLLITLANL